MNRHTLAAIVATISILGGAGATAAQRSPAGAVPAPRPIGPVVARSTQTFTGVTKLFSIGGGVFVQDQPSRQVWLFDGALASGRVVLDSTSGLAKENYYGPRIGNLLRFKGDSLLFQSAVQMGENFFQLAPEALVIGASGKVARIATMPTGVCAPRDIETTGWYTCLAPLPMTATPAVNMGDSIVTRSRGDSATFLSVSFKTWDVDTLPVRITTLPRTQIGVRYTTRNGARSSIEQPVLSTADGWAVFKDGTIAIVRGIDYHVDIVDLHGKISKGPKAPFEWRKVTDADRDRLIDSLARADSVARRRADSIAAAAPPRVAADGTPLPPMGRFVPTYASPDEWASIWPPIKTGLGAQTNVLIDEDDRIWVDERQPVGGDSISVYGIFDKKGQFLERVKIPSTMMVRGFGPGGIVYLTTTDGGRATLLKARFK